MNKHIYLLLLLSVFFAPKSKAQCNTWVPVGVDDTIQVSFGQASYMHIAAKSIPDGALLPPYHHMIYSDGMVGGKASVVYPIYGANSKWAYLGTQGFTAGQALYTSIEWGAKSPYVAYEDMASAGKASAMWWTGTLWKQLGNAGFSAGTATYVAMAVSHHNTAFDTVYVAYRDGASKNKLSVMKYTGSTWVYIGTQGFSKGAASHISLQVDTITGSLYVAYIDSANAYNTTVLTYKSGIATWKPVGPSATGGVVSSKGASYVSLNVLDTNVIYVAYRDSASSNKGLAMSYAAGKWSPYITATGIFSKGPVSYINIVSDKATNSLVGYNDDSLNGANVLYTTGSPWQQWGNANFSAGKSSFNATSYVIVGAGPVPFMAYRDAKVAGKATVMVGGQLTTQNFNYGFPPEGISTNYAYTPSIAMNRTKRLPVVAFVNQDTINHERVRAMSFNGSAWNFVGGNISAARGKCPSMGVNRDTNYVAYIDVAAGGYPTLKKFNGTAWVGVGSPSGQVATSKANYISLAFDYKNQPYVAFDDGTQNGRATVEYFNGSAWVVLGSTGFNGKGGGPPGGRVAYIAMTISKANIYVVFSDSAQSWMSILWEYHSGGWSNLATMSVSGQANAFNSIAVDSSSNVYVAMQDSGLSQGAAVSEYPSTGSPIGVLGTFSAPISAGSAIGESIALDSLFNPYVSYLDGSVNNKVTVLQYSGSGTTWNIIGTAGISKGSAIQTTQLTILGTTPYVTYQDRGTIIKKYASAPTNMSVTPALSVVCLSNNSVKLTASGGTSYTWTPGGATGASVTVTPSATTTYTVKSTIGGCSATASALVDVSATGDDIFTVAGSGNAAYNGDGGSALAASMYYATGVVFDSTYQNMYIADQQNSVIRKVNMSTNIITTIAGSAIIGAGYTGDGNPATAALLNWPSGLAIYHNNLYIADQVNSVIRKVNLTTGIITTAVGNSSNSGAPGYGGDGGPATAAAVLLYHPTGLAFDKSGNMFIADFANNRIREVTTSGTINTYVGNGTGGYTGTLLGLGLGSLLTAVELHHPASVAVDSAENVFFADQANNCIREVSPGLLGLYNINTVAGDTVTGYKGDGGAANKAELNKPIGITLDRKDNIYIADEYNQRIRVVTNSTGVINTIAGNGAIGTPTGVDGDGGAAVSAQLNYPWAVTFDGSGNIFIPDNINNRVREIKICSVPATTIKASVNPICAGSSTKITVTGGNYYSWAPSTGLSSVSTATVTATPSVTTVYSVTVNGSITDTITIHVLASPTIAISPAASHICSGVNDTIKYTTNATSTPTWTATGATLGTPTSTYVVANIPGSTATFTVSLTNGTCSTKDTLKVSVGTPTVTVTPTQTSVCRGSVDTLIASGAASFTWSPSTGLNASTGDTVIATPTTTASTITYTVTGLATGGCSASSTYTLTVNFKPTLNVTASTPSICFGNSTTLIENTSVATYAWSTGASTQSISVAPSVTNTYTVIGTTSLGCSDTGTVSVTVTNGLAVSIVDTNITCYGLCNGIATAVVTGTDTYTYSWNNGASTTSASLNKLCPGVDSVLVTDQISGCLGKATTTITQPNPLRDTISSLIKPICNGSCDGSAKDSVIGGTAPFTYAWTTAPAQSSQTATNLCAGAYTVTITDSNNCTASTSFTLTQPLPISVSVTFTAATCFGSSTGTATAKVVGGSGSFTYSWSTSPTQTTSTATGLTAGSYTVTVTDVNGCTAPAPATVTVTQASQITDSISGITGEKCNGGKTGTATIYATGGLPSYSYSWSDGEKNSNATALPGGNVTCTVTDKNGCSITDTVNIPQPAPILISKDDTTICPGSAATLTASATGGASPYNYLWSNFVSGQTNRVTPTTTTYYTVTVTDNIGCKNTAVDTVNVSPPLIQGNITVTAASSCVGASVTLADAVSGGAGTITYTWQPGGQTGSNIIVTPSAGITVYTVTVTDGCSSTILKDSINVTMYNPVFTVCCDSTIISGQSVSLVATPSAGISFVWTPSTGLSCTTCPNPIATPTTNTTYTVVGVSNGCTTIDSVTIKISNGTLVFYTGITPNGDGSNDTWVIDNIELYPDNSVSIFNRWGIEVWSGNRYDNSTVVWKGQNSAGQPLPDATYFYVAKVSGVTYKGWVQLTR